MIADVLLNCSGHNLTRRAQAELLEHFGEIEDVRIPSIRFEDDVEEQIRQIIEQIKTPLDGSVTLGVIPPGHATVAILLVAYFNGVVGYYPAICYLSAERPGDYLPEAIFTVNAQKIRDGGRRFRQSQWSAVRAQARAE